MVLAVLSVAARTAQGPHQQWGATRLSCKDAARSPQYRSKHKGGLILRKPEPGLFPARLGTEAPALWWFTLTTLLFSLQSSGNVWVTHEEMENMATSTKTVRLTGPTAAARRISYRAELQACINALNPRREGDLYCISCVSSWPAPCTCLETVFQPLISPKFLKLA